MTATTDFSNNVATFGDRLAHARDVRGLSQTELARKLGLRVNTIQSWEEDRSEPRANKLQMLAGVLSVSMIWLMTGSGPGPEMSEGEDVPIGELLQELRDLQRLQEGIADRIARLVHRLNVAHEG